MGRWSIGGFFRVVFILVNAASAASDHLNVLAVAVVMVIQSPLTILVLDGSDVMSLGPVSIAVNIVAERVEFGLPIFPSVQLRLWIWSYSRTHSR